MSGLINHLLEEYYAGKLINKLRNRVAPSAPIAEPSYSPIESKTVIKVPAQDTKAPKLKVMTNDNLKALLGASGKQPITSEPTHVCKDNCKHWVWDVSRGGRVNSLTGEFQEGEPW